VVIYVLYGYRHSKLNPGLPGRNDSK